MKDGKILGIVLLTLLLLACLTPPILAQDGPRGTIIDRTNWDSVQGLVPDPALNWLNE